MKFEIGLADRNYKLEEIWFPLSENILAWEEDFHRLLLHDSLRMDAYKNAIQEVVKPGMVVLDLGTGTGVMGLFALQAGAKHLYAIDVNSAMIENASHTFDTNWFSGRYSVFNALSYEVNLPEKVDVIISEILGSLGDNEDFVPILADARQRFLKNDGKMLPSYVCSLLVPISSVKAHHQVKSKECKTLNSGYDLGTLLQQLGINNPFDIYYEVIIPSKCHISQLQIAQEFKFDGNDLATYEAQLTFPVEVDGLFTGFKCEFVAHLSDSVVLDTSGDDIASNVTCWKHGYLPIESPVEVKRGDEICLVYSRSYLRDRNSPFRQCYQWSGTIKRDGKLIGDFHQSMEG
jgi:protein arginine N-methyltransferase 1